MRRTPDGLTSNKVRGLSKISSTINQLEQDFAPAIIPAASLLPGIPNVEVDEAMIGQIRHGRDFRTNPFRVSLDAKYVKAVSEGGELIAIGEAILPNLYHPVVVL